MKPNRTLGLTFTLLVACSSDPSDSDINPANGVGGQPQGGTTAISTGGTVPSVGGQSTTLVGASNGGASAATTSASGGANNPAGGTTATGGSTETGGSSAISTGGTSASTGGTKATGGTSSTATAVICDILKNGAKGDGTTLNTKAIQTTIDQCAIAGGGTLVVPKGSFLTGSLFLKASVNVELQEGAVLLGSKNLSDYPVVASRFEGHFSNWRAALLNGEKVDHLRITGPGTLDGNGAAFWSLSTTQGRPRLTFIRDSVDVVVSGVHYKNSGSWNLHFYNCQTVVVENSRFEIDAGASGPSTDGTDIDSCQNVTVRNCYYSVNDDCVVLKGNRYDGLNQTPTSPPVSNVHVTGCTFVRGKGALSIGTEATYVHDVEFDNSSVSGDFPTLRLKMRPDTAGQDYENINVHDITVNGTDDIVGWELTHGTKITGSPPPAKIRNVTLAGITGKTASFGNIAANATTEVSTITMKDINVTLTTPTLTATGVKGLTMTNVVINGKTWSPTANNGAPGPVN